MSAPPEDQDTARRLKRASAAIEKLQGRLAAAEAARREPIAVVGVGCRLPGAADPAAYWRLLRDGVDATAEVPADRWNVDALYDAEPATPGRMSTKRFGSIGQLKEFDAAFFGISPREARSIDPQQRLLLEVAWEALEDAGIPAKSLAGTRTGVYMAACGTDYFQLLLERGLAAVDPYFASGTVHSMAAGRLSYFLGLVGPSLSVDTACSSSLVATHLACRALRAGDCDLALVGGVNRIIMPTYGVAFSQSRMLSGDGRCKTFSARADGYGRAEGCGVVVLKRLGAAVAAGDRVLAVIRGTAVNQDGATSGLTVPNGPAQQAVIRAALVDGGVAADAVGYVEAHGTGTALGDPIEMGALQAVFAAGRTAASPLWVGSVKTNIGHAEGAAGIAGLIKVVLALRHGAMPAHLHCQEPSRFIDWAAGALAVPQATQRFPERQGRRVAGVSSFGFSGTNAHVVLEAAPEEEGAAPTVEPIVEPRLYVVSGQSEAALAAQAQSHAAYLAGSAAAQWADLCHTSGVGRAHLAHRLAVVASSPQEAATRLAAYPSGLRSGRVVGGAAPRVAFLFTGQGAMSGPAGLELAERSGPFAATLERCAAVLAGLVERPLRAILSDSEVLRAGEAQPALLALQLALVAEWRASGIAPEIVLGHSLGEYAAAVTAGVFSLESGLRLAAARGALMEGLASGGAMLAVDLAAAVAQALIGGETGVSVAAVNGPQATVLSGPRPGLARIAARLPAAVTAEWLTVTHAFHSPLMAPMVAAYRRVVEAEHREAPFQAPQLGFVSTLTGGAVRDEVRDPDYWCRQIVEPVAFAAAVGGLVPQGATHAVEIGPRPVLTGLARECLRGDGGAAGPLRLLVSLRPGRPARQQLLEALGELYLDGAAPAWPALNPGARRTTIPTYPWQRKTFWIEDSRRPTAETLAPKPEASIQDAQSILAGIAALEGLPELVGDDATDPAPDFAGLADAYARVAALPVARQRQLAAHFRQRARAHTVDDFYSRLATLFTGLTRHAETKPDDEIFLTYAPFPTIVPGFSWIMTMRFPEERHEHFDLCLRAQRDMRALLFRHVDFPATHRALDLGCGYGSDLVALARRHPGMELVGQTISSAQAAIGQARVSGAGLDERISIRCCDSATTRSEKPFDLIFGFEVIHHIADKASLFATIGRQLAQGGHLVAADFIASDDLPIDDDKTMSGFLGRRAWSEHLARNGIEVVDAIDVSEAVANFLNDPNLEAHLDAIGAAGGSVDEDIRAAFGGFVRLGELLRRGLATYMLLSARKVGGTDVAALRARNEARLAALVSYDDVTPARWFYERRWVGEQAPGSARGIASEFSVQSIVDGTRESLEAALAVPAIATGRRVLPRLEALASAYAARALAGLEERKGTVREELVQQLRRWSAADQGKGDVDAIAESLAVDAPEIAAELALLRRCGEALPAILLGERDPLEVIFPDGDFGPLTHLYQDAPVARAANALMGSVLECVVALSGRGSGARVLEVGGGTGGTTGSLLGVLRGRGEYVFTDVSGLFLAQAMERFGSVPGFTTGLLDIERAPEGQGYSGDYDVVVAANVLHATQDLRSSVRHAVSQLAPGGMLVLLEGTSRRAWVDLTFGLTEGWWRFADRDLRDYPLLGAVQWQALLAESGLEVSTLELGEGLLFDQTVVVARRPLSKAPAGDWLVMGAAEGLGGEVERALAKSGARGVRVAEDAAPEELREVVASGQWRGVVYVAGADEASDVPTRARTSCVGAVQLMQALAAAGAAPRLWLVTQGAVGIGEEETVPGVAWSSLWGLGAVARLEHPEWRCVRVDVERSPAAAAAVMSELGREDGEEQVAWRDGARHVGRLARRAWPQATAASAPIRADRSYVLTGGLGGLGLAVSRWLVDRGARHLLLLGRSDPSAEAEEVLQGLRDQGARVETRRVDVSDRNALSAALALCGQDLPALAGVLHAAGVLDDGALEQLDRERMGRVMAAKVDGAWHLHELTRGLSLDHFVLFSSAASLLGNPGQANHAAANGFLDGLARHRRAAGLAGLSINWGAWGEVGAAARHPGLRRSPAWTRFIDPALGIAALERLMADDAVATAVLPMDWTKFHLDQPASRRAPFYEAFVRNGDDGKSIAGKPIAPVSHLAVSGDADTPASLLRAALADVLAVAPETLEPDQPLHDLGFDSLMAIALRNRIRLTLGVELGMRTILQGASLSTLLKEIERHRESASGVVADPNGEGTAARPDSIALASLSDGDRDAMLRELLDEQDIAGASR